MGSFAESLSTLGLAHQVVQSAAHVSPVIVCKCLLVVDKKKQNHFIVLPESQFDGIKKLIKDVGIKDLRFVPFESISSTGENAAVLTPCILGHENFKSCKAHVESSLKSVKLVFKTGEEDQFICLDFQTLTNYFKSVGIDAVSEFAIATALEHSSPLKETDKKRCSNEKATNEQAKKEREATQGKDAIHSDKALIGMTTAKDENFADWYTQVITKAEMIEYYDVSGCYILRPWSFQIWETVQSFLDAEFKKRRVQNTYFPTFVTKQRLEAEQSHIEGFSAEVAWVTKSGQSDLSEPIAIRPTSETIMYPALAKWIRSHRDLPMILNQWNSVVRWEFKQPTPFIRTREFLWQEGHTAHETESEADSYARGMLDVYAQAYEELLAVPVCKGQKSENEKFAGSFKTYTIEGFIPANGRGLQCATSHNLGQNFAKIFGIEFEDASREKKMVWQTSWGFTTRSLGAMIMVHGDNKGLVLPPRVSPIQVVIVPIIYKNDDPEIFDTACNELESALLAVGIRVMNDNRAMYNPGWKYNHWELKGVPLRIEIGPRDLKNHTARLVRRFDGEKTDVDRSGDVASIVLATLEDIQKGMLAKAKKEMRERIVKIQKFEEVMSVLNSRNLILAPWCGSDECEEAAKEETAILAQEDDSGMTGAMKTLCIPFDQPAMDENTRCFRNCGPAKCYTLWGRSY